MKIYDRPGFPNPSRIRIVLSEKGLNDQVEFVSVDLIGAELAVAGEEVDFFPIGIRDVENGGGQDLFTLEPIALLLRVEVIEFVDLEAMTPLAADEDDRIGRGEVFHLMGGQADFYFIFVV